MGFLRLTGISGYLAGATRDVPSGSELVVGRSRSCGLSLRKSPAWTTQGKTEKEAPAAFRSVSRRHARLKVLGEGRIEITGLGANGTFLDGVRIDTVLVTDLAKRSRELRIARAETLTLEWIREAP